MSQTTMNPLAALTARCPHCPPDAPPVPASPHRDHRWVTVDCLRHGRSNAKADGSDRRGAMAQPAVQTNAPLPPPPGPPPEPIPDGEAELGTLSPGTYIACICGCGRAAVVLGASHGSNAQRTSGSHTKFWCNVGQTSRPNHTRVRVLPESEHPAEAPDPRPRIERGRS